jgi:VWFA-related protein
MIVVWNRNPEVVQPFTTDHQTLNCAIDTLDKRLAGASWLEQQKGMVLTYAQNALTRAVSTRGRYPIAQAYADSIASWRPYAEMIMKLEKSLLTSTGQMVSTLAGSESKKVCLFIGGQMPDQPGVETLQMINSMYQSAGYSGMTAAIPGGTEFSVTGELRKLAHLANASGVAMYMIDVSDRMKDTSSGASDSFADFLVESSTVLSMGMIASATGGSVLSGTKNFDVALNNLARDLGSYYSLGYRPSFDGPVDRHVSVKVSRPGAVVRSRQAYSMKTADEQMEEKVVANVFHGGARSDFDISVETGRPEPFEGHFKVPVKVTFPSTLTYIPDGADMTGGFTVFFVTASETGALSQVSKQEQTVRFPANAYFSIKTKPFTHTATLLVRPGKQSVSIAVVDKLGGRAGYATATVDGR